MNLNTKHSYKLTKIKQGKSHVEHSAIEYFPTALNISPVYLIDRQRNIKQEC